jgi:hypothetical protein
MGLGGFYEDAKARALYSQSSKMQVREEVRRRVNLSARQVRRGLGLVIGRWRRR